MDAALAAASRGVRGANPLVGAAVISPEGEVVTGYHAGAGTPHAEPVALAAARAAGFDLRASTLVVTLEPCAHAGRTPACTRAIIDAQVPRVIFATPDPHGVAAGGRAVLEAAGVQVRSGLHAEEARALNERWFRAVTEGRPFVTAKIAQSIDGRIAAGDGTSRWITSAQTRSSAHALRARVDAVVVGTGTALADNPRLTVRQPDTAGEAGQRQDDAAASQPVPHRAQPQQPIPVVIGERDLDPGSHLAGNPNTIHLRTHDLAAALRELRSRGLEHVLVEGGAQLFSAALAADLIDDLYVHIGPLFLGGTGLAATAGLTVPTLRAAPAFAPDELAQPAVGTSGGDIFVHLRPAAGPG